MKPTAQKKPRQPGAGDSPRREHAYAQVPTALLCLPTGERAAAIEVWAALHHHLRLGSSPRRITDEELAGTPWLVERSRRYRCNGLDTLERLGLIIREAGGSSRRFAITARLRGAQPIAQAQKPAKISASTAPPITSEDVELTRQWFPTLCAKLHATVHEDAR